jgi:hypothetical protein
MTTSIPELIHTFNQLQQCLCDDCQADSQALYSEIDRRIAQGDKSIHKTLTTTFTPNGIQLSTSC